jgi:hypothetical protein
LEGAGAQPGAGPQFRMRGKGCGTFGLGRGRREGLSLANLNRRASLKVGTPPSGRGTVGGATEGRGNGRG